MSRLEVPTEQLRVRDDYMRAGHVPLARVPKCATCYAADKRWESMRERRTDEWQCPYCYSWQRFGLAAVQHRLNGAAADAHLASTAAGDDELRRHWADLAESACIVLNALDELDHAERKRKQAKQAAIVAAARRRGRRW